MSARDLGAAAALLPVCLLLGVGLGGCGDPAGAQGAAEAGDRGDAGGDAPASAPCPVAALSDGSCPFEPPRVTPLELCPSLRFEQGVCLPELPDLVDWVCPEGWEPRPAWEGADAPPDLPSPTLCEPPPMPSRCPPGELPRLGTSQCETLGAECPAAPERWRDDADLRQRAPDYAGQLWFVDAAAEAGGAGTRASPFASVAEALGQAAPGDVIALAGGEYPERVDLAGVALVGACAADTHLVAPSAGSVGTVEVGGGGALLADLTVAGPRPGVRARQVDGAVVLAGVRIEAPRGAGIEARDVTGGVRLDEVFVAGGEDTDLGVSVVASRLDGRWLVVRGARPQSLVLDTGAEAHLSDLALLDAEPGTQTDILPGVWIRGGATAELERAVILRQLALGLVVQGEGASLVARDLLVAQTGPDFEGRNGRGLEVDDGASVTVSRALLRDNRELALHVEGGSTAELTDVALFDTGARPSDDRFGQGLQVRGASHLRLSRAVLLRNRDSAVVVAEPGTRATLSDVVIGLTRSEAARVQYGRALGVVAGAEADLTRVLAYSNREVGVLVREAGSHLSLADVRVTATRPNELDDLYGSGLVATEGTRVDGARVQLDANHGFGLWAGGCELDLTDLVATGTEERASDGLFGRGLSLSGGATGSLERTLVTANHDAGVTLFGEATSLVFTDLVVAQTAVSRADVQGGSGVVVVDGAQLTLRRFELFENALVGLQAARGAWVSAEDGGIFDNVVGLNLVNVVFDPSAQFSRVVTLENGVDLERAELPVPTVEDVAPAAP